MPTLPPGPTYGRLAQTVLLAKDPLGVMRRTKARFGPVFTLRTTGGAPIVVIAVAEEAARVTALDPGRAHAGAARREILPYASVRSVFGGDDEAHRASRGRVHDLLTPAAVARIEPEIPAIAERHAASWPTGRPFGLRVRLRDIADEVWIRLLLRPHDDARVDAMMRAVRSMLRTPGNPPLPPPGEDTGVMGKISMRLFAQRQGAFADLIKQEIAERRAGADGNGDGLFARFAASDLTPDEVVDELTVVTAAANEAMGTALTSVVERLAHHPDLAARFAEAGSADPTWQPVVDESLRLHPVAMAAARKLTQPETIGGFDLPAGTSLMAPSQLLHRDPSQFADPDAFVPDRFADGPFGPFFPFGGGARACVGRHLGNAELRAVVPAVLRTRTLKPVFSAPERQVQRATVLTPAHGALMRAS